MAIIGGKPFRIFIIGPMHRRPDATGLHYEDHTSNIKLAAETVIAELDSLYTGQIPFCEVIAPPDTLGDIVRNVFPHLFHCDIAIADISSGSPNVYYELAILHSLGVPVILLTEGQYKDFYMVRTNVVDLASFSVEDIAAGLRGRKPPGHLEQCLRTPIKEGLRSNPISDHLNRIPLVHYSAVSGIATGQYYNFISWVLRKGFFRAHPEYKKLVLVRPTSVLSVDDDIVRLEDVFGEIVLERDGSPKVRDGRVVKELPTMTHYNADHPRDKIFVRKIGDILIDYPTPISSLKISRQFAAAADYFKENSILDEPSFKAEAIAYERSLIETYIALLSRLVETLADVPNKFDVKTVDEIIAQYGPGER